MQAFAERQPLLRAAQRESVARQGLEEALRSLHRSTLELLRRSLPSGLGFALAVQAAFAFALLGGAWAVERQWLDGARLVAVLVLLVRFIEPLAQLTHLDQALRGAWQALDTLLRVFALAPLRSPEPGERPHDASLAAEAVELRLEDGRALLEDISLRLEPGSLNVLVGPSGAGKSSLLALLGRLYDVDAGRVLLGGVDIRRLSETTLAANRNLVFQDNGLFRGSVAWNLRMARADADLEALREARGRLACWKRSRPGRRAGTATSVPAARCCPAASGNACAWLAGCSRRRRCCCSTSPPPASTPPARRRCCAACSGCAAGAPCW